MGMRVVKTLLVALAALAGGYLCALGIGLVAFEVFDVSQREGAAAMGLAFFISPVAGLVCALIAAVWFWLRSGRRDPAVRAPRGAAWLAARVAAAVVVGWLCGLFLQWLLAGQSYDTFVVALAVSQAPLLLALCLAAATGWLLRRRKS
jgi:hypothetical protein